MQIPLSYVARNLWVRRLTTALTAGGMALVVFVFAAVLMLDAGLKATLVATGSDNNVLFIRKGAETEVQSGVARDQAALIESLPQIARTANGEPLVSKEVVVLNSLPKIDGGKRTNVPIRGVPPLGLTLRPQVKMVEGRFFRPGSNEIIVGSSVARKFAGVEIGQGLSFAQRRWTIVGVFDAGHTAFDSEIWGDAEQLLQAFRRGGFSSVIAQLATRTGEIGTLRALGFRRRAILTAFLLESLLLALVGGVVGLIAATFLQAITISTTNFQSFSEIAFSFALTPRIVVNTLVFALVMGLIGGVLPAFKAARMKIVDSLRAA